MPGFVNPYNFFPLGERLSEQDDSEKIVSGVIRYSVLTKTPLFVPNTEVIFQEDVKDKNGEVITDKNGRPKKHDHMVFNSLELTLESGDGERPLSELSDTIRTPEVPFIPGSEVRGMFRSEYEMLTGSCLSVLNDDNILSKRTHFPFSAGLIKKNGDGTYDLYSAEDCLFRAEETGSSVDAPSDHYNKRNEYIGYAKGVYSYKINDYVTGEKVYFSYRSRERGKPVAKSLSKTWNSSSPKVGYIMKGFPGPEMPNDQKREKHNLHIFKKSGDSPVQQRIDLKRLEKVIEIYLNNATDQEMIEGIEEYIRQYERFKESNSTDTYFPVYYSVLRIDSQNILFLSPSSITRELYVSTIGSVIDKKYQPCSGSEKPCPACALFGRIADQNSVASHLRFSDLRFSGSTEENTPVYYGPITLVPLSTPKVSNMEFYLQKPDDAIFWTYDYYVTKDGSIKKYDKTINGRKFYWHHDNLLTCTEKTDQNKTVYPLSAGNTFEGEIYFDHIRISDLNRLIYIINCGEANDLALKQRTRGHKIGAGRPAGLGSIVASVLSVRIRKIRTAEGEMSYSCEEHTQYQKPSVLQEDHYIRMTAFDNEFKVPVRYPFVEGEDKIFEWFSENHKGVNRRGSVICPNSRGKTIIDMPNKRNCELFVEYLTAMQGETVSVDISQEEANVQDTGFGASEDQDVEVAVLSGKANTSGRYVYFTVNGKRGSCKKSDLPAALRNLDVPQLKDKRIKVRFVREITGTDGNTYPEYKVIGVVQQ